MKKIGIIGIAIIVIILIISVITAGDMGTTSPAYVRGTVYLDDSLIEDAKRTKTLFISIRDTNQPMPPFGAFRKTVGDNLKGKIVEFALTNENVHRMMQERPWPESLTLKARLDLDGQGGMDQPGDLVGVVTDVKKGSTGIEIRITRRI